jgi:AcrR family transcriptional regulator
LDVLATSGIDAVRIEPLARSLSVTKGSFYWHFADRPALLGAMLTTWRRRATLAVIERLEKTGDAPKDRLHRLIQLPFASSKSVEGASLELAIRLWAKRDPQAAAAVEEVDQHRLTYLGSLLRAAGLDDLEAQVRAYLIYSYILAEAIITQPDKDRLTKRCEAFLLQS